MADISGSMGIGGSGGVFGRKTELVADLTSAFKTLNAELTKTRDLSAEIAKNLKGAFPGGGGNDVGLGLAKTSQETTPAATGGAQTNLLGKIVKVGAAVGLAAYGAGSALMQLGPSAATSVDAQIGAGQLRGFGQGTDRVMQTMQQGSFQSANDALNAAMTGQMYGMGAGNAKAMSSYSMLSNINPGMTGQQAAAVMGNINTAQNVNAARMIGINIRDNKGGMRSIQDIANDIWSYLNRSKRNPGAITKLEIDNSLQPGNALDSILNTYFGGSDANTRESIVKLLYMKAGVNTLDKAGAQSAGFLAKVTAAGGKAQTSIEANALGNYGKAQTAGITDFQNEVAAANKALNVLAKSPIFDKAVEIKTLMDQNTNALNALTGVLTGLLAVFGGGLLKDLFGKGGGLGNGVKNIFSKGKGLLSKGFNFLKGAGSKALNFGKSALHDAGSFAKTAYGDIEPIMGEVEAVSEFAGEEALGAGADVLTGGAATGIDLALQGVMMKQLYDAFHKKKGKGGSDNTLFGQGGPGDGDGDQSTSAFKQSGKTQTPVAGGAPITSKFGDIRYLTTSKGKIASYGKPHGGVDFGISTGTPVRAVKDGKIIPTSFDTGGFGNYVQLHTDDDHDSYYGHLSNIVASGQVKAGDVIGYSGNSGNSTGPHLHYEVRKGQTKIDPMAYLKGAADTSSISGMNAKSANPTGIIYGGEGIVPAATYGVAGKGDGAMGQTVNYGGVTIQVNIPQNTSVDHKKLIEDIKSALQADKVRAHAMGV